VSRRYYSDWQLSIFDRLIDWLIDLRKKIGRVPAIVIVNFFSCVSSPKIVPISYLCDWKNCLSFPPLCPSFPFFLSNPVHNVRSGRRLGVASILDWRKIRCDMDEKVEEWEYIFPLCVFIYFSGMSFPSFYLCSAYLVCELVSVCVYVIGIMFNKEARIDYDTGWCDHFWHSRTFLYLFQSCEFIYVKNVILQGICSFSSSLLLCVVAVALLSVSNVSFFSSNFCQWEGWGENLCPVSK